MTGGMQWWEAILEVPPQEADRVAAAILPLAYGGVAIEPAIESEPGTETYYLTPGLPAQVKAYLAVDRTFPGRREALLQAARDAAPGIAMRETRLAAADWSRSWKAYFKPVRTGRQLLIRPPWSRAATGDRTVIELEPGMAFGTGDHPTTKACLAAVERLLRPGDRLLDLGSGSGILAIAGAKLGASKVLALDTDPLAVDAAKENCRRNGVADIVRVVKGSIESRSAKRWHPHLLLTNLTSALHAELAELITRAIVPGGSLFGAGIGEAGLPGVLTAYGAAGVRGLKIGKRGAWRTVQWTKPG